MSALRRDDRGASLPELLVAMIILGIIIVATATLAIGFHRSNGQNIARQDQIDAARVAAERMTKTVRTAVKPSQLTGCVVTACEVDAFISAGDFGMKFYANLDNADNTVGPSQVTYSVPTSGADAGVLIEKVQVPDSATPSASGYTYCNAEAGGASAACQARLTVRRISEGVLVEAGSPIFRFYDKDGAAMATSAGQLTAAQIERLLAVELTVRVQSDSSTHPAPTTYIQRVLLPNSQAVLRPGEVSVP